MKEFLANANEVMETNPILETLLYDEIKHAHVTTRTSDVDVSVPSLRSFKNLDRILNMPDGWEKYVSVDYSANEKERHNHILAQGKAMVESE